MIFFSFKKGFVHESFFIRLDFRVFLKGLEACGEGFGEGSWLDFQGTLTEKIYA